MPPIIDKEKCIECGTCAQICPLDVIRFVKDENGKKHVKVNSLPWYDIIIMLVGAAAFFYYSVTYDAFVLEVKSASSMTSMYSIIGLIGILAVVELCRRCVGLPILCVAGALVIYTFAAGIPFDRFIYTIFYSVNGILRRRSTSAPSSSWCSSSSARSLRGRA